MNQILERIAKNAAALGTKHPDVNTMDNDLHYGRGHGGSWVDSFWVGMLYLAYAYSGDSTYLTYADGYQPFYRLRIKDTDAVCEAHGFMKLDHDTGFLFTLSQVARFKLTGDREARDMALRAADILAARFHEKGSFIRAWDTWKWDTNPAFIREKKGKTIIDSLMNLPLLMWAFGETNDSRYGDIAVRHADTVLRYMVRADGSTCHTFNFDPDTGEPIGEKTGQGYADDSCWSRGQSWAVYGFALLYAYTGEKRYQDAFLRVADYFWDHLTTVKVPVWDFAVLTDDTAPYKPWDSSAGCIAACGMLEMAAHLGTDGARYRARAAAILDHTTRLCATLGIAGAEPILLHGCGGPAYRREDPSRIKPGICDTPLLFGDYFYTEALMRMEKPDMVRFW